VTAPLTDADLAAQRAHDAARDALYAEGKR